MKIPLLDFHMTSQMGLTFKEFFIGIKETLAFLSICSFEIGGLP